MADRFTREELAMLAALVGQEIEETKSGPNRARRLWNLHAKLLRCQRVDIQDKDGRPRRR